MKKPIHFHSLNSGLSLILRILTNHLIYYIANKIYRINNISIRKIKINITKILVLQYCNFIKVIKEMTHLYVYLYGQKQHPDYHLSNGNREPYISLPRIYKNKFQRKKLILQQHKHHYPPYNNLWVQQNHKHQKQPTNELIQLKKHRFDNTPSIRKKPLVCHNIKCFCNIKFEIKKPKINTFNQRKSIKLEPLTIFNRHKPDDFQSKHKVHQGTRSQSTPTGLQYLIKAHQPTKKMQTEINQTASYYQPNPEKQIEINHKLQKQQRFIFQGQQHIKKRTMTCQPRKLKKQQNNSSTRISSAIFQTNNQLQTMFYRNDKLINKYERNSQIQLKIPKKVFKVPDQSQYFQFLKNYKSLDPKFVIKKLVLKDEFYIIKEQNAVYFGQVKNDIRQGLGLFISQSEIFEGTWINDCKHKGFLKKIDNIYEGEFKNDLKSGKGVIRWNNGEVYDGQFKKGMKNGYGIWTSLKGDRYEGQWFNNKQCGQGVYKYSNSTFKGNFINFLKQGQGQEIFSNGDSYIGQYSEGKPNGKGIYRWNTGEQYVGQFVDGKRQGKGKLIEKKGITYQEGLFKNDCKHGQGVQLYPSGESFIGCFEFGIKKNGKLYQSNGNIIQIT